MGREKDRRVKGNLQPAGSSRAADLLASGTSFGFPAAVDAPAFGASGDWELNNAAAEVKVLFKRLSKRDNTTRVKALEDLSTYVAEAEVESVNEFLPAWPKTYNRLSTDADRRVREMTGNVHLALVNKVRKQLAPHLKELIGSWLCATHDPHKEVARLAQTSFQIAFPSKRIDVLAFCQSDILRFVVDNLMHQTPETMSDPRFTSSEDMKSRYARVVSSALLMLASLIEQLPGETLDKEAATYDELYENSKFWKLASDELFPIRKAFYAFIKIASQERPEIVSSRLETISVVFPGRAFSDKEISNHGELWEALLVFTSTFPEAWILASKRKLMMPKLYSFLRSGASGSASVVYPSLLPLIAHLPREILLNSEFQQEFLSSLWAGLDAVSNDKAASSHLIVSYLECIFFLLIQCRTEASLSNQETFLIEVDMFRSITAYLYPNKAVPHTLLESTSQYIVKIGLNPQIGATAIQQLTRKLAKTVEESLGLVESGTAINAEQVSSSAPDLLESIFRQASKTEIPNTVQTCLSDLVVDLFTKAMARMADDEYLVNLAVFTRKLSESFPKLLFNTTKIKQTLLHFAVVKLHKLAENGHKAVPHMLDIVVMYISQLSSGENDTFQKCWNSVMKVIFSLQGVEKGASLSSVLKEVHQAHLQHSFNLGDAALDAYIRDLMSNGLGDGDQIAGQDVEDILAVALMCNEEQALLTPETRGSILQMFQSTLTSFAKEYLYNASEPSDHSDAHAGARKVSSICHIIDKMLAGQPQQMSVFSSVAPDVLTLASVSPIENNHLASETADPAEAKLVRDLSRTHKSASSLWTRMTGIAARDPDTLASTVKTVSSHWTMLMRDPYYCGGLDSLTQQIQSILTLAGPDQNARAHALQSLFQDQVSWREESAAYTGGEITLSILDPILSTSSPVRLCTEVKDLHGLTKYARLTAVAAKIVSNVGIEVLGAAEDGSSGFGWVLTELLRMRVVCDHAEKLQIESPWGPDAHDISEETRQTIGVVLNQVIDVTPERHNLEWHQNLAHLIKGSGMEETTGEERADILSAAVASAFASVGSGSDYRKVLSLLFSKIFKSENIPSACADVWLDLAVEGANGELAGAVAAVMVPSLLSITRAESRQNIVSQLLNQIRAFADCESAIASAAGPLSVLNAVLGLYESKDDMQWGSDSVALTTLLPSNKAVELLRRVRGWYERDGAIVSADDRFRLDNEVAILVEGIIQQIDVGINLGGFVVALCKYWIHSADIATPAGQVILYRSLNVYSALLDAQHAYADTYGIFEGIKSETQLDILNLFVADGFKETKHIPLPRVRLHMLLADITARTPEDMLLRRDPFSELFDMIYMPSAEVQVTVYGLLRRLIAEHVQAASLRIEMKAAKISNAEDNNGQEVVVVPSQDDQLPAPLVTTLSRDVPKWDLEEADHSLATGTLSADPARNDMLGYLLSAMALFDHIGDATFDLKSTYISHVRNLNIVPQLLEHIFTVFGVGRSRSPFDLARWDIDHYDVTGFDETSPVAFPLLAAHVYWKCLRNVPSLVRIWWAECKNRQLTIAVESYTERFFSPLLIRTEVDIVQQADPSAIEDLVIKVSKSGNEVTASYTVEDATLEMVIRLPTTFPLRQVDVDSGVGAAAAGGRAAGISEARWRAWLLSASAVIASQNGSIADAVKLYSKNISLHFKGVEDCAICYSVIGVIDRTLPTKQCKTCKHKFHASCLFKWFRTSNQSTCPLCRQPTF
ncbi:hypothetical protein PhCBS80983_g00179 [Powellomyces hirtus]|uniref:E3 ubiquitin-protein ligase listerin n=1 Tax=Powellomyces hirtus TaxID=109895 RepID=A0A507EHV8_9FUNG|nr:hypothetical protein PhCBS80983_g00179 [Powellomyces hirtus]